jgi:hypothetical protein
MTTNSNENNENRRKAKPKRWGLRTVGFLAMAAASLIAAQILNAYKNDSFVVLTFFGLVVGLLGAGVCTYRGLKTFTWLPRA